LVGGQVGRGGVEVHESSLSVGTPPVIYHPLMATRTSPPRRRMRAPERRAQLLDVARRAFGASGFHAVSMEAVAREAGVTKPILYDHFPSKKDLYLALIDADLATLHEHVQRAL